MMVLWKKSQDGFGIVEVLIALALLGGLIMGVMEVTKMMTKSSAKFSADSDVIHLTNEIISILSVEADCTASFLGQNPTTGSATVIKQAGVDKLTVGSFNGNTNLLIAKYDLTANCPDVSLASQTTCLRIEFNRKKLSHPISKPIRLYVELDGSGNIQKCRALSGGASEIWKRGSGTDIYYDTGRVGVGTTIPASTLDVNGEIKVGNSGAICSAAEEGSQRYNSVSKRMEFCNGTLWKDLGGTIQTRNCVTQNVSTSGATCSAGRIITQITSNGGDWGGGDTFTCCELYLD